MSRVVKILWILVFCLPAVAMHGQDAGSGGGEPILEQWREVLRYGIDTEVLKVVKAIGDADERSLDAELVGLFRQSLNTEVRAAILQLFAAQENRIAEDSALRLLSEEELEDPALQVSLIGYLAAIGSSAAESRLLSLVEGAGQIGADERVVESALLAVGKVGSSAAGALLLEKLGDPEYPESLKAEIILALGKLKYQPAVDQLMGIIADGGAERIWRMYAAASLGEIGDPRAVAALRDLFREEDSLVKVYAASALANFGMADSETLLHQGLRDSNERVRAAAAKALGNPEATGSVDILIYKARNDPSKAVRLESIRALGRIGNPAAVGFLRELYADQLAALPYREEALLALCDNDLRGNISVIEKVVDSEWATRDHKVVGFTARALSTRKSAGLEGLLGRLLTYPDVGVRIFALRAIGTNALRGLRDKVQTLAEDDPHPAVRQAATSVLGRL